jgi:mono/diheme cytochrome c family protein
MKAKFISSLAFGFIVLVNIAKANPPIEEEGKGIFNTRCASCHNINKALTGPALAGVHERRSMDWIVNFVRSSQGMVKSGDKDAVTLYEKFNRIPMPDHPDLTDENIQSIVEYIKLESKTSIEEKAPFAKPGKIHPKYLPLSVKSNSGFFISYLLLVAFLVLSLLLAVHVKSLQRKMGRGSN